MAVAKEDMNTEEVSGEGNSEGEEAFESVMERNMRRRAIRSFKVVMADVLR